MRVWQTIAMDKTRLRMIEQVGATKHKQYQVRQGMRLWRDATFRLKRLRILEERRKISLLHGALRQWRNNVRMNVVTRGLEHAADASYILVLSRKAFSNWVHSTAMYRQLDDDDRVHEMRAVTDHKRINSAFSAWHSHARDAALEQRAQDLLSKAHREASLHRSAFASWRLGAAHARRERTDEHRGDIARRRLLLRRAVGLWQRAGRRAMALRVAEVEVRRRTDIALAARTFVAWQERTKSCICITKEIDLRRMVAAFIAWQGRIAVEKQERKIEKKVQSKISFNNNRCLSVAFDSWMLAMHRTKASQQRGQRVIAAMQRWRMSRIMMLWRLAAIKSAHDSLARCIPQLQNELLAKHDEILAMNRHMTALIAQLEDTMLQERVLAEEHAEKDAWIEHARHAMSAMQHEHHMAQETSEAMLMKEQESRCALEESLQARKVEVEAALQRIQVLQKEAQDHVCRLNEEKSRMEQRITDAECRYGALESRYALLNNEFAEKTVRCQDLEQQNQRLHSSQRQLEDRLTQAETLIQGLEEDMDVLRHKYIVSLDTQSAAEENSRAAIRMTHHLAHLIETQHHDVIMSK